jgi:hypothetical protein
MKNTKAIKSDDFTIVAVDGTIQTKITVMARAKLEIISGDTKPFMSISRDRDGEFTITMLRPVLTVGQPDKECLAFWVKGGS